MRGRGYEFTLVSELTLQKSVQNLYVLSGFGTKMHGELHALWLLSIFPPIAEEVFTSEGILNREVV